MPREFQLEYQLSSFCQHLFLFQVFLGCQTGPITGILIHSMHKIQALLIMPAAFYQQEQTGNDEAAEQAANLVAPLIHLPREKGALGKRTSSALCQGQQEQRKCRRLVLL